MKRQSFFHNRIIFTIAIVISTLAALLFSRLPVFAQDSTTASISNQQPSTTYLAQSETPAVDPAQDTTTLPTQNTVSTTPIIIFTREACGSCQYTKQKITEYSLDKVLDITLLDVETDAENYRTYRTLADQCGIAYSDLGVPMMVADGQCFIGTSEVLGYLYPKAGIKIEDTIATPGSTDANTTANTTTTSTATDPASVASDTITSEDITSMTDLSEDTANTSSDATSQIASQDREQLDVTPSQYLFSTQNRAGLPSAKEIVFIVLAPLMLLTIGYLLVKKLKL